MKDFEGLDRPDPPPPSKSDLATFTALQAYDQNVYGFRTPEAELRQTSSSTADGAPAKRRDFPGVQSLMNILMDTRRRTDIPVPALAIFALPHVPENWINKTKDPKVRDAAATYYKAIDRLTQKQAQAFRSVPTARVIAMAGSHYIFVTNESEVLREMQVFLGGLK
jgi:hypothetical protein